MNTLSSPKQLWYKKLTESFTMLTRKHGLPEDIADEFLGFIIDMAKQQYKAGNSSGIIWARKNPVKPAFAAS
ncbi:MAG: hypothetical protein NUV56_02135 [Candidatus Uhrbacteria bacterium]|nr:hypothetical protein [Candidatus Uhrbacteria bacterium]